MKTCEQMFVSFTGGDFPTCPRRATHKIEFPDDREDTFLCEGHARMVERSHQRANEQRIRLGKGPHPDLVKTALG